MCGDYATAGPGTSGALTGLRSPPLPCIRPGMGLIADSSFTSAGASEALETSIFVSVTDEDYIRRVHFCLAGPARSKRTGRPPSASIAKFRMRMMWTAPRRGTLPSGDTLGHVSRRVRFCALAEPGVRRHALPVPRPRQTGLRPSRASSKFPAKMRWRAPRRPAFLA